MKQQPHRHNVMFDWWDVFLGIAAELTYPVALGLIALALAWLVVRLH